MVVVAVPVGTYQQCRERHVVAVSTMALATMTDSLQQQWQMKREMLSPRYTTDWKGLPAVHAG